MKRYIVMEITKSGMDAKVIVWGNKDFYENREDAINTLKILIKNTIGDINKANQISDTEYRYENFIWKVVDCGKDITVIEF